MQDQPFPFVSKELLEALQEHFPDRSPDLRWSDREVWFKAGQSAVVRFLKGKFDEQHNNILERPL